MRQMSMTDAGTTQDNFILPALPVGGLNCSLMCNVVLDLDVTRLVVSLVNITKGSFHPSLAFNFCSFLVGENLWHHMKSMEL